jgi:hypothetical protein
MTTRSILVHVGWACLLGGLAGCSPAPSTKPATSVTIPPLPSIKPQESLEELLEQATEFENSGDLDAAIQRLERAVLHDYTHREVLLRLTRLMQQHSKELEQRDPAKSYQRMVQSGGYLRVFREAHSDSTDEEKQLAIEVLYNEARAHARSQRLEELSGTLGEAVGAGFTDFDRIARDPDFDPVRDLDGFKQLMARLQPK